MSSESSGRKQRLKEALRDNLRRRKAGGSPGLKVTGPGDPEAAPGVEGEAGPSKPDAQ